MRSEEKNGKREGRVMPFEKKTRDWWVRVAGGKCQAVIYSEENGFKQCSRPAQEVHHIVPEAWTRHSPTEDNNSDTNNAVGLPLCRPHHSGYRDEPFSPNASIHPDMGKARREYPIMKPIGIDQFSETAKNHQLLASKGIKFWEGDTDEYYLEKMKHKATIYQIKHPHDKKPK